MMINKRIIISILNYVLNRRYIIWRKNNLSKKQVCLTFDDGPSEYTEKILNILDANQVKAIFFLVGKNVKTHFPIARKIVERGHIVGNHGFDHKDMTKMSLREFLEDINNSEHILGELCGKPIKIYRPPYGGLSLIKLFILWGKGYKVVMWSKDIKDYASDTEEIQMKKINNVTVDDGDIFLFHDSCRITSVTIDDFIKTMHKRSVSFSCNGFV